VETKELDTTVKDRYLKKADNWYNMKLGDKEGAEVYRPSPAMQAYIDAGFTDPRQQYSNEFIDPRVTRNNEAGAASMDTYKQSVDTYKNAQSGLDAIEARPPEQDWIHYERNDAAPPHMMHKSTRQPDGSFRDDGVVPYTMIEDRHTGEGFKRTVGPKKYADSVRTSNAPDTTRQRNQGGVNTAKTAMQSAMKDAVGVRVGAGKQNAKANAQADAMKRQGRTPFSDEMAQRMAMLRSLGFGG
jgi:hypothetical protein